MFRRKIRAIISKLNRKPAMKKHYKTLDIEENATPQEVKKAYKKKASKAHPDAGGNDNEMAEINVAYSVLSKPDRRKRYDETGDDKPDIGIEEKAKQILLKEFSDYFNSLKNENVIVCARESIKEKIEDLKRGLNKGKNALKYMQSNLDKVKIKEGVNLAKMILENNIKNIEQEIIEVNDKINTFDMALIELDKYESEEIILRETESYSFTFPMSAGFRNPWSV